MQADAPQSKQNVLTLRDLEVMKMDLEGQAGDEIAEELKVCRKTITNTKSKPAYRDLILSALEQEEFTVQKLAGKLVTLTEARKDMNVDGTIHTTDDNTTRLGAVRKLCDIFGVDAPKELDIKASTAQMTNDELLAGLTAEVATRQEQLNGALMNHVPSEQTSS